MSQPAKYSHIFWDWNGTLLDDTWLCVEILNRILDEYGIQRVSVDEYRAVFGFPVADYYHKLGLDVSPESFSRLGHFFTGQFAQRYSECSLRDGSLEAIDRLHQEGVAQCILSAMEQQMLNNMISTMFPGTRFEHVAGLPDRDAVSKVQRGLALLQNTACPLSKALMVGDTDHDNEVAMAMEINCVLLTGGHQSTERLKKTGAPVMESLDEVLAFAGIT